MTVLLGKQRLSWRGFVVAPQTSYSWDWWLWDLVYPRGGRSDGALINRCNGTDKHFCICVAIWRHFFVCGECANFFILHMHRELAFFYMYMHVWDETCVVFRVSCTVCVLWERLCIQHSLLCACVHICTRRQTYQATSSQTRYIYPPFSSPLFDLVKHPIISLIIAMLVVSSLPRALPHLRNLLGNPEGDLELNLQPFFPLGSILRSERPRQCA